VDGEQRAAHAHRTEHLLAGQQLLPTSAASQPLRADGAVQLISQAAQSSLPCVNSQWLSQWEPVIFDHPQNLCPLTDL